MSCSVPGIDLSLSPARSSKIEFDDEDQEITYTRVQVVESLRCRLCSLELSNTAEVIAAGLPRLVTETETEDRYEGWQEFVTWDEAVSALGAPDDYGND
jgi:hypothetical protein